MKLILHYKLNVTECMNIMMIIFKRSTYIKILINFISENCRAKFTFEYNTKRHKFLMYDFVRFNPLNAELNPMCCLLALLGVHQFLHVSRIRVKLLTLRLLMSYIYIYMEHPFLMFLYHTQRRTTVGRIPLDE